MTAPAKPGQVICHRPSPWRDLRHAALGAALCLTIVYALAGADEEIPQPPRAHDEVTKTIMNLGDHLCGKFSSQAQAAINLDNQIIRYRCRNDFYVEAPVVIR